MSSPLLKSMIQFLVEEQEMQTPIDPPNNQMKDGSPEKVVQTVGSIFDPQKDVVVHSEEQAKELERLHTALVNARKHFNRGSSERLLFVAAAKAIERKIRVVNKEHNKKQVLLDEPTVSSTDGTLENKKPE